MINLLDKIFNTDNFTDLSAVKCWNKKMTIKTTSVAEHSYFAALFVGMLCKYLDFQESTKYELVMRTLLHDFDEIFSGDIYHGLKHNNSGKGEGLEIAYLINNYCKNKLKEEYNKGVLVDLREFCNKPYLFHEKLLLKFCDHLSMMMFCKNEIQLGNRGMLKEYGYIHNLAVGNLKLLEQECSCDVKRLKIRDLITIFENNYTTKIFNK